MSLTLSGELTFFGPDTTLLGCDCDDLNEPVGDSFTTRCENKRNCPWIDAHEDIYTPQDHVAPDEDGEVSDEESVTYRQKFALLSDSAQEKVITQFKDYICRALSLDSHFWEPSVDLILDAIESEMPDVQLVEWALADYLATPKPPEGNPSDDDVDLTSAADDFIPVSQCSRERSGISTPDDGDYLGRRGRHQLKSRRRNASHLNTESHTPKYKHQDWRHQLPRIEAKMERRMSMLLSDWEYPELEEEEPTFLSVQDQLDLSGRREEFMDEWTLDLLYDDMDRLDAQMELEMHQYYGRVHDWYEPSMHDYVDWDRYSPLLSDDNDDLNVSGEPYANFDADAGRDDIFEDYGNMNRYLDEQQMSHASRPRFTCRYRPTRRMLTSIAMLRI